MVKTTNMEYEKKDVTYTEEELRNIGTEKIENELIKEIEDETHIVNKQVNIYNDSEYIEIEVIYEVLENIGVEDKI